MKTRQRLLRLEVPFAALGLALVGCAFLFAAIGTPIWIPPAPLVRAGIPSPLSGMTRSFVALASGDVWSSFVWHPLGPPFFIACLALPALAAVSWFRDQRPAPVVRLVRAKATWIVVALAVAGAWARQIVALS